MDKNKLELLKKKLQEFLEIEGGAGEMPENEEIADFISDIWGDEGFIIGAIEKLIRVGDKETIKKVRSLEIEKKRFDKLKFNENDPDELHAKKRFLMLYELYKLAMELAS